MQNGGSPSAAYHVGGVLPPLSRDPHCSLGNGSDHLASCFCFEIPFLLGVKVYSGCRLLPRIVGCEAEERLQIHCIC